MITLLLLLHILSAVVWVGGMFFAHQMVRPSLGPLDPVVRLPIWRRIFARFFPWGWAAVALLLVSGLAMQAIGVDGLHVKIMEGFGVIMMLAYAHLYFAPWQRF